MKRILFAIFIPIMAAGCVVEEHHRPAVTSPSYVAQCPRGYRYDGHDCHRIYAEPHRVDVEIR